MNQVGFPGGSDDKESACNARDLVQSLGGEDPMEKGMATHSSILPGIFPTQGLNQVSGIAGRFFII